MSWRWLALPLLLALPAAGPQRAQAPSADAAGNRVATFAAVTPPRPSDGMQAMFARHCTADRIWCARLQEEEGGSEWRLELTERGAPQRNFEVAGPSDEETAFAIRPSIVIEQDGAVLIGIERTRATGYSGGGASSTRLVQIRAEPGGGALRQVLDVPLRASKDIRACFGPRDTRRRRGACSDQYEFAGTLTLDPATRAGRPSFLLSVRARTYPGRRNLGSDSTTAPPLRPSDLRWATDPTCTYRRRIVFDPRQGLYLPDRPHPACADYLDF
jgi:hypothetical protein